MAFYLDFKIDGEDIYPKLREAVLRPEIAGEEPVRIEMFRQLGYFPTESSGHNSEYNPWFRKRPDLIEKYCSTGTGWNPGEYAYILREYLGREDTWEAEYKDWLENGEVDFRKGEEYASDIFNAILGNHTPFPFNANIRNHGYITNIDDGACVEVPAMAVAEGIVPSGVHTLPQHLSILINHTARIEELAVQAAMEGDAEKVFQAVLFDPLTSSVLSMEEIRRMVREMLAVNAPYLTYFKNLEI